MNDKQSHLRIELDTENCELSVGEFREVEEALNPMRSLVRDFPVAVLYVTVTHHEPTKTDHVNVSLVLSGQTLTTSETDEHWQPALRDCIGKLTRRVKHYKADLGQEDRTSKFQQGTYQEVIPNQQPDADSLRQAVEENDYVNFRRALYVYEEPLRKRIGRWVKRYPEWEAQLGDLWQLEDAVEEVFLFAFEKFNNRPNGVRLGQWLEDLIDPALNLLMKEPAEELLNVHMVQSAREATESEPEIRPGS